jgi:hypothetical protein
MDDISRQTNFVVDCRERPARTYETTWTVHLRWILEAYAAVIAATGVK